MNKSLICDALYYLSKDSGSDPVLARGVLTGLVTGIMAATGRDFQETIALIKPLAREDTRTECIPKFWLKDWEGA